MTHTSNLTYSRWERLVFRFTGRWPDAVVSRRLNAVALDEIEARELALRAEPFVRVNVAANREKKSRVWFGEDDVKVLNALNRIERDSDLVTGYLQTRHYYG